MLAFPYCTYRMHTGLTVPEIIERLKQAIYLTQWPVGGEKPYFGQITHDGFELKTTRSRGTGAIVITGTFQKGQGPSKESKTAVKVKIRAHRGFYLVLAALTPVLLTSMTISLLRGTHIWTLFLVAVVCLWAGFVFVFARYVKEFRKFFGEICSSSVNLPGSENTDSA